MIGKEITTSLDKWIEEKNFTPCTLAQKIRFESGNNGRNRELCYCYDFTQTEIISRIEHGTYRLLGEDEDTEKLNNFDWYDEELMNKFWAWSPEQSEIMNIVTRVGEETISSPFRVTLLWNKHITLLG